MFRKGCILLMCGLPSSGKTLLANNLVNYSKLNTVNLFNKQSNVVFYKISIDELIPIGEQYLQIQEKIGFWRQFRHDLRIVTNLFVNQLLGNKRNINEVIDKKISSLLESIKRQNNISSNHSMDKSGKDFLLIIDDNMYYKSMRYEFFQTSKQFYLGFAIIMINCSVDLALNRNRLRTGDQRLPEDVIIKMSERFECPKLEGFEFRTYFVCADSFVFNITEELIEFIIDAINNPVIDSTNVLSESEEEVRQKLNTESKDNLIHKIDCILRQLINEVIVESIEKKNIAKNLNESKKRLLTDIKQSIDFLPQNIVKYLNESQPKFVLNEDIKEYFIDLLNKTKV